MIAGAWYIPKASKRPLGEDAFFISDGGRVIGVADGVGGWSEEGIDAGEFARELMCRCESLVGGWPCGLSDPAKILEAALSKTRARGTAPACVIAHKGKFLHAAAVGDCGFAIIREDKVIYRSPQQQKSFNYPYQLGRASPGDPPLDALRIAVAVERGDLVVAGSDGLFDNMFDEELESVVAGSREAGRARVDDLAYDIAQVALQFSTDRGRRTPFSAAYPEDGQRHVGGKEDDITVVVARVVCTCNNN